MSTDPKKLLDTCLEIEGLLALVVVRNGHCSSETYELLKSKAAHLKEEVFSMQPVAAESMKQPVEEIITVGEIVHPDEYQPQEVVAESQESQESEVEVADVEMPAADVASESEPVEVPAVKPAPKTTNESLMAMFSINDKFLYCRELFGSSREEMNEALDVISNMNSTEEIEDYLFNDLCLDSKNETVKAFLNTMSSRFANK